MALNQRPILSGSILSNGAITIYRGVDFAGNQAATQGMAVRGIAQYAASAAGQYVEIVEKGSAIVEAGAAITAGQDLIVDNQGRAIPASALAVAAGAVAMTSAGANGAGDLTGTSLPSALLGRACNAASGAGQFVEVLLV